VKDYTGKEVELIEQIDESLIGGFILKVGDQQIDDSIKRKLNDLKVSLAS
jgi:F-type H+-transporting ATPase subunit delta